MVTYGIHIFGGTHQLVPREVELELEKHLLINEIDNLWRSEIKDRGILFDLKNIEWVDLASCIQIILLIESALMAEIKVGVKLPNSITTWEEKEKINRGVSFENAIKVSLERRIKVRNYLKHLRFYSALKSPQINDLKNNLNIIEEVINTEDDFQRNDEISMTIDEIIKKEELGADNKLYANTFPFLWISIDDERKRDDLSKFLTNVIKETKGGPGLDIVDAKAISNVILYELVENVSIHSISSKWAIVSAIVRTPKREKGIYDTVESLSCENGFINWVNESNNPVIDIVLGDSGVGIAKKLYLNYKHHFGEGQYLQDIKSTNANVMLWAFDRWSTSRDEIINRGTRGLYRVDRIAKKYQGLITMRSSDQYVGYDHGGPSYDKYIFHNNPKLAKIPGTIIRLRLPVYNEKQLKRELSQTNINYKQLWINNVHELGLSNEELNSIKTIFADQDESICLFVISNYKYSISDIVEFESIIRQLTEIRHPGSIIFVAHFDDWTTVENICDLINSEHIRDHRDQEWQDDHKMVVWDPIIIYGGPEKLCWAGVNSNMERILDFLFTQSNILSKETLINMFPSEKERGSLMRQVRNDTGIFEISDDGSIKLKIQLLNLEKQYLNIIQEKIRHKILEGSSHIENGIFRTPSLAYVKKWYSLDTFLPSIMLKELIGLAISIKIKHWLLDNNINNKSITIVDPSKRSLTAESVHNNLNTKKFSIAGQNDEIPVIAEQSSKSDSDFIVHTDLISEGEAVRIGMRHILQERGKPILLTCIIDARPTKEVQFNVWGYSFPLMSLVEDDISIQESKTAININPISGRKENSNVHIRYKLDPEVKNLIAEKGILKYLHLERSNGRHFTFFVDRKQIVTERVFINWMVSEIQKWETLNRIRKDENVKYEIWYPQSILELDSFTSILVKNLTDSLHESKNIYQRPIQRIPAHGKWFLVDDDFSLKSQNIVILDWGIITGNTLSRLIKLASEKGADSILICVILNQMDIYDGYLIEKSKTLEINSKKINQTNLFVENNEVISKKVKLEFKFYTEFDIPVYGSFRDCPICLQRPNLIYKNYPHELLSNYAFKLENEYLKPQTENEAKDNHTGHMFEIVDQEVIIDMHQYRNLLTAALGYTKYRQQVFDELMSYTFNIDEQVINKKLYAMITLLSIETNWLRNPPLYFKKVRDLLAEICYKLIANEKSDEVLKYRAIVVLRISSRLRFAGSLQELIGMCRKYENLIDHILYNSYTYLQRPFNLSDSYIKPIVKSLEKIREGNYNKHSDLTKSQKETIDILYSISIQEQQNINSQNKDVLTVWKELKGVFSLDGFSHHDNPGEIFLRINPGPDEEKILKYINADELHPDRKKNKEVVDLYFMRAKNNWQECLSWLERTILPRLNQMQRFLSPTVSSGMFDANDQYRYAKLIYDVIIMKNYLKHDKLYQLLNQCHNDPQKYLSNSSWSEIKRHIQWYHDNIFKSYKDKSENENGSLLFQYINKVPSTFSDTWMMVRNNLHDIIERIVLKGEQQLFDSKVSLFLPTNLLYDLFELLVINGEKHKSDKKVEISFEIIHKEKDERMIYLECKYKNTLALTKDNSGQGIKKLNSKISYYNSKISATADNLDGELSFQVNISIMQY